MSKPLINHSLTYNPSLDGIRGIAILSVVLFHIWPHFFYYGYLGVDLFFLLSGYLITRIIYTKLAENNFKFREFYRNRVRRIFPAVIIVLSSVLLAGYMFLFSSELMDLGRHIESSSFFYENFRLMGEVGYWDKAAELKPTLHFWSLSIEEQFYIFWPFIIYLIHKLKLNLLVSLSVLMLVSVAISFSLDIDRFYHFLSRFWELILGALLYGISAKYSYSISAKNRILSFGPLVFLGLISFPLYLWHYVIISYIHIFELDVSTYGFVIIIISICLSFLIYRYVEIYARRQQGYIFASSLFVMLILVGFMGKLIYERDGLPNRTFLINNHKFEKQFIRESPTNKAGKELISKIISGVATNDYIEATTDRIDKDFLVIIGDSHAHSSYPGFSKLAKKYGLETILLANSSCPPYLNSAMGKNIKELKECKGKIDTIYTLLDSNISIKKVIFATRANSYIYDIGYGVIDGGNKRYNYRYKEFFDDPKSYNHKDQFFHNLNNTFEFFSNQKYDFYYLMEDPELGFSPKNCLQSPFRSFSQTCKLPLVDYLKRSRISRAKIYATAQRHKEIYLLDPKAIYCDDKFCYAAKDGKMLYADDDHHSVDGSMVQAQFFERKIFDDK